MTKDEIEDNIKRVISKILKVEISKLKMKSGPMNDLLEWDSMAHMMILMEIESFFNIKFEIIEIENIQVIDDICRLVKLKLNTN